MAEQDNTFLNADNIYEDVEGESGKSLNLEADQQLNLAGLISDRFQVAEDARRTHENRWLTSYQNYRGLYGKKIKFRESFRPFAPSILEEHVSEYFDIDISSPYMLFVCDVKQPEKIPAVTHVDGTARLQTVSKESNPLYYELINEFYTLTGVPVLINTSMNVMGEPIVNTPEQAYNILVKTDMDILVMGNNIISRK